MATQDRSALEGKAVAELKEIAKSLDLKVTGLKKAEIIDRISGGTNGAKANSKPKASSAPAPAASAAPEVKRESAPPAPTGDDPSGSSTSVRDESAVDERDNRNDDRNQQRRMAAERLDLAGIYADRGDSARAR